MSMVLSVTSYRDPIPFLLPLSDEYEPLASDLKAFEVRVHAMAKELVGMIKDMRIVSSSTHSGLRLVTDNTR
jgi:hypothetical protein